MDIKALADTALAERVRLNHAGAFEEVFKRYWEPLYIFAFKRLKDEDEAKVLTRERCVSTKKLSNVVFNYLYRLMNSKQNTPDGEWVAVHQEIGGNVVPPESYAGQKLVIRGSTYMVLSDNADEGIIKTNGDKLDM